MQKIYKFYDGLTERLRSGTDLLWPFFLRAILAWEFFEAGLEKLNGQNWFGSVIDNFPIPFKWLSADLNWFFATWGELTFSVLLFFGLFTRFAAVSLIVITAVATAAVHWPESWSSLSQLWDGYAISNKGAGNFKLPLLFILMLFPLVFQGGGKLSLDKVLLRATSRDTVYTPESNLNSWALVSTVLAVALIWVLPKTGISLLVLAAFLAFSGRNKV